MRPFRTLFLPPAALALFSSLMSGGAIEGVVVNAATSQPLRRADVVVRQADLQVGRGGALGVLETDGEGRFQVAKLPAGEYTVQVQRSGFHSKTVRFEVKDSVTTLRIRLSPHSVISGRVVDDEGEPMPDAQVTALARFTDPNGRLSWRSVGGSTNDRGEFRLWGIAAGRYYVRAQWRQNNRTLRVAGAARSWLPTYFPNALSTEEASPVVVTPGLETSGIEISLRRGSLSTVSGTVELTANPARKSTLVALVPKGTQLSYDQQTQILSPTQNSFRFDGVRPGSWVVTASTLEGDPILRGSLPIEVSSGDIADLAISVAPAAPVRGKALMEGGRKGNFGQVGVSFDVEDPGQLSMPPVKFDEDGNFGGQLAAPARYRLRVNGRPAQDSYVSSIRLGSQEILGKVVEVPGGTIPPLTIEFRSDGAKLGGLVDDLQPDDEYVVVLLSTEESLRNTIPVPDSYVRDGRFEFRGLRPGTYFAVAVEADERGKLDWPETLASLAQIAVRIEVQAGSATQLSLKPARFAQ